MAALFLITCTRRADRSFVLANGSIPKRVQVVS